MEKKKISIDVEAEKWDRMKKVAKINNSTGAQEFRKFMDRYLKENAHLELQE